MPHASVTEPIRVLVVDDDVVLVRALQRVLTLEGFDVDTALDGRAALARLADQDYDVMLLDLRMGSMDGMEVFAATRDHSPPATIIHSAHVDVRTAVLATRAGVQDVMQKPVPEEMLATRIRELSAQRRAGRALQAPSDAEQAADAGALRHLVGNTPQMADVREQVRRVANFRDVSVLVHGPTGTGKELVAQAVHALSCPDEPFVSVNCAAIPEQLFESELFGHDAGAFTSAKAPRVGLLEEAGRGTLFLDEVGEMPFALQVKLLRVLEIRQFRRVGSTRTRVFSARVVSATNRPVSAVAGTYMRPDLFFRLAGYAIRTPALAERIADVPELARHFLVQFAERHQVAHVGMSHDALEALVSYSWPGNVRELRAVIENAGIVARNGLIRRGDIELALQARADLGSSTSSGVMPIAIPREGPAARPSVEPVTAVSSMIPSTLRRVASLPDLQRDMILRVFEDSQKNLSRAAQDLGIPRSTLRARLKRYGVR